MDVVDRLLQDRPVFHGNGTERWDASPGTLRAIKDGVRDGSRTLETGCGASTVIFAAQGAHHTVLSPDGEEHKRVRSYLEEIGVEDDRLDFIVGASDQVLPNLCTERVLDAAFIDGAHGFPYPAVDWHYVARALKIGGKLVLDDISIRAVASVFHYMQSDESWRLDAVLDERAAAFTLIDEPPPEHSQPFNRHPDYGFASFGARPRLILGSETRRIRRQIGQRYPGLQRAWRRLRARRKSR